MATLRPSIYPSSASPRRNGSIKGAFALAGPPWRNPITAVVGCCARAARGHSAAAPPMSVMNSRRPLSSMALSSLGGRPNRSPPQAARLGGNVYQQHRHHEDQNRVKPGFHDVGTPIPPLLYRLLFHGGSPWVANRTLGSPHQQPATEWRARSLGQT